MNNQSSNRSSSKRKALFMAAVAVSRFRSAVVAAIARRPTRVVGTLYGRRRGHVQLAFQVEAHAEPLTLLELPTPTDGLVREMAACGLMRIALECDRRVSSRGGPGLAEEPAWRVYCNGRHLGWAVRRECGPEDWKVLRAVEPVSVGAGVLPAAVAGEGEVMYMRGRFERVVGSKDAEAFYMMNPDGNGGPELSVYLLRV
ncbi:hypothetical protein HPP92_004478 [Vanilla planifolia]|uniref:Protein MIZU-KUSSEI 1 n=1 Tax=Vanilla planifolia TaxID=51239 RepID=A0A835RSW9_VANPL|nr:hypothetical protein HPP92_004855 [Vanilla planifolia]KAG0493484.1 hypothetical protein HPP92_004478 [Vanilla planifolia]